MNIEPLGFIDTAAFTSRFVTKHRTELAAEEDGTDRLWLRDEHGDLPPLKDWKSANALLAKIRSGASKFLGKPGALGRVAIVSLKPNTTTPWRLETDDSIYRLQVCLIPSPAAYIYSGGETALLPVGMLNLINHRVWCSEVNFADFPRVHLVVDVLKPTA